jgi:hypothetical protein
MPKCNKKIILLILIFLPVMLLAADTGAKKIGTLDSILQPRSLHVYGDRAYVVENYTINIISLGTGELINSFGKRGEGPGEFKRSPVLRIYPDFLAVNSWGKLVFFGHEGRYIKEMKHQFGRDVGAIPLGDRYVAQKSDFSEKDQQAVQSFGIYNSSFNLVKTIFQSPNPFEIDILPGNQKQPYPVIHDNISLDVYEERIYIADSRKGFYFKVFDSHGKWLHDIKADVPPTRVSDPFRTRLLEKLKSEPWWKQFENKLEPVFPEFLPEIRFFTIQHNKIYVQTFIEKEDDALFRIHDLTTKKMSTIYLPRACDGALKWYDIQKGDYYYLRENEDTDMWELFVVNISGIQ